jgi:hypothetical protein
MPRLNLKVLAFLLYFLNKVQSFEKANKMGAYNLAVVFAPSLFRPKTYSFEDVIHAASMVACLRELIVNYKEFITEEEEKVFKRDHDKKKTSLLNEWRQKEKMNSEKTTDKSKEIDISDVVSDNNSNRNMESQSPSNNKNSNRKVPTLSDLIRDSARMNHEEMEIAEDDPELIQNQDSNLRFTSEIKQGYEIVKFD